MLSISGTNVEYTKRDMYPGQRPYAIDICAPGAIAIVTNVGLGQGDEDTISVIDVQARPPRVIETISVGQTPEGVICSRDGRLVAVTVISGSNKPPGSPFYRQNSRVIVFKVDAKKLVKFAEADVGMWSQGAAFSPDGRTLLMQNTAQKEIQVLEVGMFGLRDTGQRIKLKGGPVAIRTAVR